MKKNLFLMLGIVMILASCSKGPKTAAYIPNDALVVTNINVKQILDKADAKNIDNISFIKIVRQELRSENAQLSDILDDIIANPTSTGLDLREDIIYQMNERGNAALIIPMHKQSKFENFLTDLAAKNGISCNISKEDGFKKADLDIAIIAYNGDVAIIPLNNGNPSELANDLFNLDKDKSLANSKNFKTYWKERSELGIWMDMNNLFSLIDQFGTDILASSGLTKEYLEEMRKGSFACNLVFDKGALRFVTSMQGIDKKVMKDFKQDFNSDIIKYMPEKCLATFAFALPMEKMVEMIAQTGEFDVDEPIVDGKSYRELSPAYGGSFVLSLFDFTTGNDGLRPLLACATDIKDAALVRKVMDNVSGFTKRDGMYIMPDFGIGEILMCVNDKAVYMTNSEEAAKQFVAGGYKNSMKEIASRVKKGNYFYADLNLLHYPDNIIQMVPDNIAQLLCNYLDYTEIKGLSDTKGEWAIYLAEKKENSLLATLHFIDNNLIALTNLTNSFGGNDYADEIDYEEEYEEE